MKINLIIGSFLMILGVFIISLPDSGVRLFSISLDHGPSFVDLIGILILLLGYLLIVIKMWQGRMILRKFTNTRAFRISLFLSGLGSGLVIASVAGDFKEWWVIGCSLLAFVQLLALYAIVKKTNSPS